MRNRLVVQLSLAFDKHKSGLSQETIDSLCMQYGITPTMVAECFDFYLQKREETKAKINLNKIPTKPYVYVPINLKKYIGKYAKTPKNKQPKPDWCYNIDLTTLYKGANRSELEFLHNKCEGKSTMALALAKAGLI